MPTLTRRRYPERPDCWHIYYGDVQAGTVARRVGNPFDTDPWEWNCGFYPGSHPGECGTGTSATFDQARADFEQAWEVFLRPISESGAMPATGTLGNMRCGHAARKCLPKSPAP